MQRGPRSSRDRSHTHGVPRAVVCRVLILPPANKTPSTHHISILKQKNRLNREKESTSQSHRVTSRRQVQCREKSNAAARPRAEPAGDEQTSKQPEAEWYYFFEGGGRFTHISLWSIERSDCLRLYVCHAGAKVQVHVKSHQQTLWVHRQFFLSPSSSRLHDQIFVRSLATWWTFIVRLLVCVVWR